MIIHDVEQGSPEWFQLRAGVPTASCFGQIACPPSYKERFDCGGADCKVAHQKESAAAKCKHASGTPRKFVEREVKLSESFDGYMLQLLAEVVAGKALDTYQSDWMRRGHEFEAEARTFYEFQKDVDLEVVGFVTNDAGTVGASPDAMGLEIKCPAPKTHVRYLLEKRCPPEYIPQVQGNMWICETDTWDFMSYHPDLPPLIVTVQRDDNYIDGLSEAMDAFLEKMESKRHILESAA